VVLNMDLLVQLYVDVSIDLELEILTDEIFALVFGDDSRMLLSLQFFVNFKVILNEVFKLVRV